MKTTRNFQRRIESFLCGNCGVLVKGDGYTNHCPSCLWSRHVDINPGDRAALCGGLMEPIGLEIRHGEYFINQRCTRCPHERKNKIQIEDDFSRVISLSAGDSFDRR